jgi:CRP-like cAMP-binding protein
LETDDYLFSTPEAISNYLHIVESDRVRLVNPQAETTVEISARDFKLFTAMDGRHSVEQLGSIPEIGVISPKFLVHLIHRLAAAGMLKGSAPETKKLFLFEIPGLVKLLSIARFFMRFLDPRIGLLFCLPFALLDYYLLTGAVTSPDLILFRVEGSYAAGLAIFLIALPLLYSLSEIRSGFTFFNAETGIRKIGLAVRFLFFPILLVPDTDAALFTRSKRLAYYSIKIFSPSAIAAVIWLILAALGYLEAAAIIGCAGALLSFGIVSPLAKTAGRSLLCELFNNAKLIDKLPQYIAHQILPQKGATFEKGEFGYLLALSLSLAWIGMLAKMLSLFIRDIVPVMGRELIFDGNLSDRIAVVIISLFALSIITAIFIRVTWAIVAAFARYLAKPDAFRIHFVTLPIAVIVILLQFTLFYLGYPTLAYISLALTALMLLLLEAKLFIGKREVARQLLGYGTILCAVLLYPEFPTADQNHLLLISAIAAGWLARLFFSPIAAGSVRGLCYTIELIGIGRLFYERFVLMSLPHGGAYLTFWALAEVTVLLLGPALVPIRTIDRAALPRDESPSAIVERAREFFAALAGHWIGKHAINKFSSANNVQPILKKLKGMLGHRMGDRVENAWAAGLTLAEMKTVSDTWPQGKKLPRAIAHFDIPAMISNLDRIPIFASLGQDKREALPRYLRAEYFEAGETIVEQGEDGYTFYAIHSGTAEVLIADASGAGEIVAQLDSNGAFGEVALIEQTTRTATVRAQTPLIVYALDRNAFNSLIDDPTERKNLTRLIRSLSFLERVPLFEQLNAPELVALYRKFKPESAASGETVIKQGDNGDKFYLIEDGEVSVSHDDRGAEIELARLGRGSFFGEIALLKNIPRTASVTAREQTRMLALTKHDLEEITASFEHLKNGLFSAAANRVAGGAAR